MKKNVAKALGKFALRVEGYSKHELRRGHGVLTGTLRRSIHVAQPGYNWGADDLEPKAGTPELGGQMVEALINGRKVTIRTDAGEVSTTLGAIKRAGRRGTKPKTEPGTDPEEH